MPPVYKQVAHRSNSFRPSGWRRAGVPHFLPFSNQVFSMFAFFDLVTGLLEFLVSVFGWPLVKTRRGLL
jgi:hypothetical protein